MNHFRKSLLVRQIAVRNDGLPPSVVKAEGLFKFRSAMPTTTRF